MIEAARNLACVGAVPKALVNCLNFGNPEHPEVMWQFAEVVDGMGDACRALGIPVVGGNVSFYNESRGRDIDPTPVVGVVGLIDDLADRAARVRVARRRRDRAARSHRSRARRVGVGDVSRPARRTPAVGRSRGRGRAARPRARHRRGARPRPGRARRARLSDGGLAVALAEMAIAGGCGVDVALASELVPRSRGSRSRRRGWSSPSTPTTADALVARARAAGVPAQRLGTAGGDRLVAAEAFAVDLAAATHAWRDAIPNALHPERTSQS